MWSSLKEELSVKQFLLRLDDVSAFTTSSILHPFILLTIRLAITIFCMVCLICSGFEDSNGETKWFIYLTNWSYTMLTISFILLTILSACAVHHEWKNRFQKTNKHQGQDSVENGKDFRLNTVNNEQTSIDPEEPEVIKTAPSRWYHQITWLLYNVAFCLGIFVTIAYWGFVQRGSPNFIAVSTHALNAVFILAEVILGCVPIRLLHVVYTMVYLIVYEIFTVIYWQAGGRNAKGQPYIYEITDYESKSAGLILGTVVSFLLIGVPVCQLLLFCLYKLRCHLFGTF